MKMVQFFRNVYGDNVFREKRRRQLAPDLARYAGNTLLRPFEEILIEQYYDERLPIIFIVGAPRTGSTLLYQLMARFFEVGYVNNFVARFWMAPIVGSMLFDSVYGRDDQKLPLRSSFGSTPGPASPHEFAWFWQYWTNWPDWDDLSEKRLKQFDWQSICRELAGLAGYFGQPLLMKSLNYTSYQVSWLSQTIPNAKFVWMTRDSRAVIQSVLKVRKEMYGTEKRWWSVRPSGAAEYDDKAPILQAAYQYFDINRSIGESFEKIADSRGIELTYEKLTESPRRELKKLAEFLQVSVPNTEKIGKIAVTNRNRCRVSESKFDRIEEVVARFQNSELRDYHVEP